MKNPGGEKTAEKVKGKQKYKDESGSVIPGMPNHTGGVPFRSGNRVHMR